MIFTKNLFAFTIVFKNVLFPRSCPQAMIYGLFILDQCALNLSMFATNFRTLKVIWFISRPQTVKFLLTAEWPVFSICQTFVGSVLFVPHADIAFLPALHICQSRTFADGCGAFTGDAVAILINGQKTG